MAIVDCRGWLFLSFFALPISLLASDWRVIDLSGQAEYEGTDGKVFSIVIGARLPETGKVRATAPGTLKLLGMAGDKIQQWAIPLRVGESLPLTATAAPQSPSLLGRAWTGLKGFFSPAAEESAPVGGIELGKVLQRSAQTQSDSEPAEETTKQLELANGFEGIKREDSGGGGSKPAGISRENANSGTKMALDEGRMGKRDAERANTAKAKEQAAIRDLLRNSMSGSKSILNTPSGGGATIQSAPHSSDGIVPPPPKSAPIPAAEAPLPPPISSPLKSGIYYFTPWPLHPEPGTEQVVFTRASQTLALDSAALEATTPPPTLQEFIKNPPATLSITGYGKESLSLTLRDDFSDLVLKIETLLESRDHQGGWALLKSLLTTKGKEPPHFFSPAQELYLREKQKTILLAIDPKGERAAQLLELENRIALLRQKLSEN